MKVPHHSDAFGRLVMASWFCELPKRAEPVFQDHDSKTT
jgi:hypothetical protein